MKPINLPAANIIERSASKESAISSPDPQQEINPITSFIEEEDDLGAVVDKRSARFKNRHSPHFPMGGGDISTSEQCKRIR
ncbi:unnamed protein product, partial [Orchesella dallaii]